MSAPPALSVVMPAFDEHLRIEAALGDVVEALRNRSASFEIIVSDDGSTDGTPELVERLRESIPELRLVRNPRNEGKGRAVALGMREAVGQRVLFCDADGATPMSQIAALEAAIDAGADIAVGSRALDGPGVDRRTRLHRRLMGRAFASLVSRRLAPGFHDTQCGFKLFTADAARRVADRLTVAGFGFDLEIFVIASRQGLVVREVPVRWYDSAGSKVRLVRDSLEMIREARRIGRQDREGRYGA